MKATEQDLVAEFDRIVAGDCITDDISRHQEIIAAIRNALRTRTTTSDYKRGVEEILQREIDRLKDIPELTNFGKGLLEELESLLLQVRALLTTEQVQGWLPIESAPKIKGNKVLLFVSSDDDGDCYKVAYWSDLAARPGWFYRGGWLEENEPDGWMPLPAPPVVEIADKEK